MSVAHKQAVTDAGFREGDVVVQEDGAVTLDARVRVTAVEPPLLLGARG